jgi:hypothetical protein
MPICSERFSSSSSASFSRAAASSPSSSTMRFSAASSWSCAVRFAERTALRSFLRQLALEFGDLHGAGGNAVEQFDARAFQATVGFARQFKVLAQLLGFAFERGRLALDLVEFGAQRVVRRPRFGEHAGKAQSLRLFQFERAQCRIERRDDLVEGILEFVEFADLAAGVAQQVAQGFVFLAHARAGIGKILGGDIAAGIAVAIAGCRARWRVAFAAATTEDI